MKFIVLIFMVFIYSCHNNNSYDNNKIVNLANDSFFKYSYVIYKSDSVIIEYKSQRNDIFLLLSIGNKKRVYNLSKMNILIKSNFELEWVNKDYACIMTWWSLSQSRYIFVPTNNKNELIYFDKDIKHTDIINNNVVYIDSFNDNNNKVFFKVENLLTRKSKHLELKINEQNFNYPFYKKIKISKDSLLIYSSFEKKRIEISDINLHD